MEISASIVSSCGLTLLARVGERAPALRHFESFSRLLRDEVATEPTYQRPYQRRWDKARSYMTGDFTSAAATLCRRH